MRLRTCLVFAFSLAFPQVLSDRPEVDLKLVPPESLPADSRVWTDADGNEVAARIVDAKQGFVLLQKSDGTKLSVPLAKLSEQDHIYARQVTVERVNPKAEVLIGKVVKILDGDTIRIANALIQVKTVRLNGVDAPEKGQDFAGEAVRELEKLVGHFVRVETVEVDQYNRVLAEVYTEDGRWLNHKAVADGLAWRYKKYSKDERLAKAEDYAREAKVGIWSKEGRIAPWDWREGIRGSE